MKLFLHLSLLFIASKTSTIDKQHDYQFKNFSELNNTIWYEKPLIRKSVTFAEEEQKIEFEVEDQEKEAKLENIKKIDEKISPPYTDDTCVTSFLGDYFCSNYLSRDQSNCVKTIDEMFIDVNLAPSNLEKFTAIQQLSFIFPEPCGLSEEQGILDSEKKIVVF